MLVGNSEKLNWNQIELLYDKEWVELVDYDWRDEDEYPSSGIVRVHSKSRKEFDKLINQDPPESSALVFVGKVERPKHSFLSTFHQIKLTPVDA